MEEYDYDKIIFPEGISEHDQEGLKNYFRQQFKERSRLCVIYNPDCKCNVDQFVVLDRFPMSEKILCMCPVCDKGCLMEISDPIIFHCPIRKEDYTLDDLKNMHVKESDQKPYIDAYQKM
jgi:hypothetical protein